MRFKNSYAAAVAAAVAAVVFSAAFQPAEASTITIDGFDVGTATISGTTSAAPSSGALYDTGAAPFGGGIFDTRQVVGEFIQSGGSLSNRTAALFSGTFTSNASSSGLGVFSIAKGAIPSGTTSLTTVSNQWTSVYSNADSSSENLTITGNPALDGVRVVIAASTTNGTVPYSPSPFDNSSPSSPTAGQWIYASDAHFYLAQWNISSIASGTYTAYYSSADWIYTDGVGNPIPSTSFDWTQVNGLGYGLGRSQSLPGSPSLAVPNNAAFATSVSLDSITIVPEPTQMVSVAGIGAAYGAWRLRKLRRSRTAAGDAVAG
jgi:hypothetical protein